MKDIEETDLTTAANLGFELKPFRRPDGDVFLVWILVDTGTFNERGDRVTRRVAWVHPEDLRSTLVRLRRAKVGRT